jgi:hypothetical protein
MRVRARVLVISVAVLVVLVGVVIGFVNRNEPQRFSDIEQHFLYGSIGSEDEGGIPYWVWRVLPDVFPDLLEARTPGRDGTGYERLGFLFEDTTDLGEFERPIGTSIREAPIPLLGLNCAVCHVGTVREPDGDRIMVLGMPAQQLDFLSYQRFLLDVASDPRFNIEVLAAAIRDVNPDFSKPDELFYGQFVVDPMRETVLEQGESFAFLFEGERPPWGPGRVETFTPYKVRQGLPEESLSTVGTADFPSLWNQDVREAMSLHWDGNNDSLAERNLSAAIGAGASESSLDLESIERVAEWILTLQPPSFPRALIDDDLVDAGEPVYATHCAACHSLDGARVGQVEPIDGLGTDPARLMSFDGEIASAMNQIGAGLPWAFSRFRSTNGYANAPLDGIWLRAPYLHNGSVPTLADLLEAPSDRPTVFCRGDDQYDYERLGFVQPTDGDACEGQLRFDTALVGNGNGGHVYGTELTEAEKRALLEFLKTQ